MGAPCEEERKCSFLKKRTKNFYPFRVAAAAPVQVPASGQRIKVFWCFFSKKNKDSVFPCHVNVTPSTPPGGVKGAAWT
jgi:hypothetical protein